MNRKIITIITIVAVALIFLSGVTNAAVAHAHSAGVPDCRYHSMKETCWGMTEHIDTITRKDAEGYTRARFEYRGSVYGDTGRNYGIGISYADTNNDEDIPNNHFCAEKDLTACTYYDRSFNSL